MFCGQLEPRIRSSRSTSNKHRSPVLCRHYGQQVHAGVAGRHKADVDSVYQELQTAPGNGKASRTLLPSGGSGIDSFAKRCDCIDSIERIGNLGFKNGSFGQSVVVFDPDSAVAGRTVSGTDSAGTYYSGTRSTRNQRMM